MEAVAHLRHLRIAPRKVSIVADIVRGKPVGQALAILKFTPKAASEPMSKLLKSAIANAEDVSKGEVDIDRLYVKSIVVNKGTTMRRFIARAMGRATPMKKRTSHVTVVLTDAKNKK